MFDAESLYSLGLPRIKAAIGPAKKAANAALQLGASENIVADIIRTITLNPETAEIPDAWRSAFEPFVEKLKAIRQGRTFFADGLTAATWKNWADESVEAGAIEQMKNACQLPVSAGGALMPDAHTGYGLPIGGVLAVRNAVIPYAVGVDIACRMRLTVLKDSPSLLDTDSDRLAKGLESETRFGIGASFSRDERRDHPVIHEDWSITPPTKAIFGKAMAQLGTSGCGNHFIEFGTLTVTESLDEPELKLPPGVYLALLSHSGSRGSGETVASYYSTLAQSLHPELPKELRHLAWLDLGTPEGDGYWKAMELMGRYAAANHELIHKAVIKHLGLSPVVHVENHHNFAWKERYGGEELIVHRKGATPAGDGVLGVVPGSMGAPGFIVRGKGNPASFASCSHGAGRRISRRQAYQTLSKENMMEILRKRRVRLLSGPLDESPEVYKDIEAVIERQSDLIDVLARFDPRLVKMAPEEGSAPAWRRKKK